MSVHRLAAVAAGVVGLAALGPAHAEPVRISTGGDASAQGYLFASPDGGCHVATPFHVVARPGRDAATPRIFDRRGREHTAGAPARPDPALDLAFLTVPAPPDAPPCTTSRLGPPSLELRLARAREGFLENFDMAEGRQLRVDIIARATDALGGGVFGIASTRPGEQLYQGMSGGLVSDAEGPLGLLLEVDPADGRGLALRMDVVRRTFEALAASRPTPPPPREGASPVVTVVGARTVRPEAGALAALLDGAPLHLAAARTSVDVEFRWPSPVPFAGVAIVGLSAEGQGQIGIEISPAERDGEWATARTCARPPGDTTCTMLRTTTAALRIRFRLARPALLTMERLELLR